MIINEITVFDGATGKAIYSEIGEDNPDIKVPVDFSFDAVNDFVHCADASYDELRWLCLGLANELEKANAKLAAIRRPAIIAPLNVTPPLHCLQESQ